MENIKNLLIQIEHDNKVKVLYACETGSRAWGFPSPDSDYDVRFLYMHEQDWYLKLNASSDTLELMHGDLDVTGWDLRKSLRLLKKSNTALIERFQSPIEYCSEPGFKNEFMKLVEAYYSPIAVFFHHYSLSKKIWEEIHDQPEVKLKKYFYLVRSLLSCNWIMRDSSVLPMHIEGLMHCIDDDRKGVLREMIQLKATVNESHVHPLDSAMRDWLKELMEALETRKNNLPVNDTDYSLINSFFIKTLYEKDNDRMG